MIDDEENAASHVPDAWDYRSSQRRQQGIEEDLKRRVAKKIRRINGGLESIAYISYAQKYTQRLYSFT